MRFIWLKYLHELVEIIISESAFNLHGHHAAHVTVFLLLLLALLLPLVAEAVPQSFGHCRVAVGQKRLDLEARWKIKLYNSASNKNRDYNIST